MKNTIQKTSTRIKLFCQPHLTLLGSITSLMSVAMLFVSVPSALAAQGCTPAPSGYICVNANGQGRRITKVAVVRGKS